MSALFLNRNFNESNFSKEFWMKFFSLIIALCFTMNVFASTGSLSVFEGALDDYQYSMIVEWDQKDKVFQQAKTREFIEKMNAMIASGQLSQKDIITVVEKKLKNKTLVDAMKLKVALAGDVGGTEELLKFMNDSSEDLYSQGASWNGHIMVPVAIVLTAVVALGFAMWYSATHGCQEYAQTCDWAGCRNNYDECVDHGYVGPHL